MKSVESVVAYLKKQNQSPPLAGNPKLEALNPKQTELAEAFLKKQTQFAGDRIQNTEDRRDKGKVKRQKAKGKTGNQKIRRTGRGLSGQQGIRLCGYESFEKTKPISWKNTEYRRQNTGDQGIRLCGYELFEKTKPISLPQRSQRPQRKYL